MKMIITEATARARHKDPATNCYASPNSSRNAHPDSPQSRIFYDDLAC